MTGPRKTCTFCKVQKPLEEFYVSMKAGDGHQSMCKSCDAQRARTLRAFGPSGHRIEPRRPVDHFAEDDDDVEELAPAAMVRHIRYEPEGPTRPWSIADERWANAVVAEMYALRDTPGPARLHRALALASADCLHEDEDVIPVGWEAPENPKVVPLRPEVATPDERRREPRPGELQPPGDNGLVVDADEFLDFHQGAGPMDPERERDAFDPARRDLESSLQAPRASQAAANRLSAPRPKPVPKPGDAGKLCGCRHDKAMHENGTGACSYGKGSPFGGCSCLRYHLRKLPKYWRDLEGPHAYYDNKGAAEKQAEGMHRARVGLAGLEASALHAAVVRPEDVAPKANDPELEPLVGEITDPRAVQDGASPRKEKPMITSDEVLACIGEGRKTTAELKEKLGDSVSYHLSMLKKEGAIVSDGRGEPWRLAAPRGTKRNGTAGDLRALLAKGPATLAEIRQELGAKAHGALMRLNAAGEVQSGEHRGDPWTLTAGRAKAKGNGHAKGNGRKSPPPAASSGNPIADALSAAFAQLNEEHERKKADLKAQLLAAIENL